MTSSSSSDRVSSVSEGIKTFFTTGIAPWTSYSPILWLKVASPKSAPDGTAAKEGKKMKEKSTLLRQSSYRREIRISFWISNCKPSKAACSALLVSSKNSSEAADKYKIIKILYANTMLHMHTKKSKHVTVLTKKNNHILYEVCAPSKVCKVRINHHDF